MLALLLLQPAAQPTGTALTASNSENLVSGMVSNGDYRIYNVEKCDYNVTLFSVYPVFAAHQIEWNTMGKTMAWWSVLIGLPKTADISETEKVRFYASGAKHVAKVAKGLHLTGKRVLDFGCGLGRLSFAFANQLGATVTCVDQSVHHLRIAEQDPSPPRPPSSPPTHTPRHRSTISLRAPGPYTPHLRSGPSARRRARWSLSPPAPTFWPQWPRRGSTLCTA